MSRRKTRPRRCLTMEPLERRELLSADLPNPGNPLDVTDDLLISARDALVIINRLGRPGGAEAYYCDVNGDGRVTALDALRVINSLSGHTPEITLRLNRDTDRDLGGTTHDRRTFDLGISGRVNFASAVPSLFLGITESQWLDVSWLVQPGGNFSLDDARVRSLLGTVGRGPSQLRFSPSISGSHSRLLDVEVLAAPPQPQLQVADLEEDRSLSFDLRGSTYDPDSDPNSIRVEILHPPDAGVLQVQGAVYVYQPPAQFHGTEQIVYEIFDEQQGSGPMTLTITVQSVNDVPELAAIPPQGISVTDGVLEIPFAISDADGDAVQQMGFATTRNPLAEIRDTYGLVEGGAELFNLTGLQEKWLFGKSGTTFFLLPSGDLIQWRDSFADSRTRETLVARLDPSVYEDPTLLLNAPAEILADVAVQLLDDRIVAVPAPGVTGGISIHLYATDSLDDQLQTFPLTIDAAYDFNEPELAAVETLSSTLDTLQEASTPAFVDSVYDQANAFDGVAKARLMDLARQLVMHYEQTEERIAASQQWKSENARIARQNVQQMQSLLGELQILKSEFETTWSEVQAQLNPDVFGEDPTLPPIFINGADYRQPARIPQGETLEMDFLAIHPTEAAIHFIPSDVVLPAHGSVAIGPLSGQFTWQTGLAPPGLYHFSVVAKAAGWQPRVNFQVEVLPNEPVIESLVLRPAHVTDVGTDEITLWARGAIHPNGAVDRVSFYQDADGDQLLNLSLDHYLGEDGLGDDGWSWSGLPEPIPQGDSITFFARSTHFASSATLESSAASVIATVLRTPPMDIAVLETLGLPTVIHSGQESQLPKPRHMARDGNGRVALVRHGEDGGLYVERHHLVNSFDIGDRLAAPVKISDSYPSSFSVASDADGNLVVVYATEDWTGQQPSSLWMVRIDARDRLLGDPVLLATQRGENPWQNRFAFTMAMNEAGQGVIAWKGYYSASQIFLQTFSGAGASMGMVESLPYSGGFNDDNDSAHVNSLGQFIVAWPGQVAIGDVQGSYSVHSTGLSGEVFLHDNGWSVLAQADTDLATVIDPSGKIAGQSLRTITGQSSWELRELRAGIAGQIEILWQDPTGSPPGTQYVIAGQLRLQTQNGISIQSFQRTSVGLLEAGGRASVAYELVNSLDQASETVPVAFYLSHDDSLQAGDRLLGTFQSNPGIGANSSLRVEQTLNIPINEDPFWAGGSTSLFLILVTPTTGQLATLEIPLIKTQLPPSLSILGDGTPAPAEPAPLGLPWQYPGRPRYIRPSVVLEYQTNPFFLYSNDMLQLIAYQFISAANSLAKAAPEPLKNQLFELAREIDVRLDTYFRKSVTIREARDKAFSAAHQARERTLELAQSSFLSASRRAEDLTDKAIRDNQSRIDAEQSSKSRRVNDRRQNLNSQLSHVQGQLGALDGSEADILNVVNGLDAQPIGLSLALPSVKKPKWVEDLQEDAGDCAANPQQCVRDAGKKLSDHVIRLRDDAKAKLQPIVHRLQTELSNAAETVQREIDIAVKPLKKAIRDAQSALTRTKEDLLAERDRLLDEAHKTYQRTMDSLPDFNEQINAAKDQIRPSLDRVSTDLAEVIDVIQRPGGLLPSLQRRLQELDDVNPFGSFAEIEANARSYAEIAQSTFDELYQDLAPIVDQLHASGGKFADWSKETGGTISDWTQDLGEQLAQWGEEKRELVETLLADIANGAEYYWEQIVGAEAVAYQFSTPGTLALGYVNGSYYADINLPGGAKLDTGTLQNWVKGGANELADGSKTYWEGGATIPSFNPLQWILTTISGGQVKADITSDYYDIRDQLLRDFETPVYYSSERMVEWLSLEAQASALVMSLFNEQQWANEAKRQGVLELGRFLSWLDVHNLKFDALLADALKQPQTAAILLAPLFIGMDSRLGPAFALEMNSWMSTEIHPRGLAMSDGRWAERNALLVRDPFGLYSEQYLVGLVGLHPQGREQSELREAMSQLFAAPTSASRPLLDQLARLRGRSSNEMVAEYEKFKQVLAQRDASGGDVIEQIDPRNRSFMASEAQLRYGTVVGDAFGIDAVFAAALNPTGGMVGPGNIAWQSSGRVLSHHGVVHDAAGYLYNYHAAGPGYDYLGLEDDIETSNPLAGQRSGIAYWAQVLAEGYPLRVMLVPGGPVQYNYTLSTSTLLGGDEIASLDLPHLSFGLTYTGRDTIPGILDPYRAVLSRDGFDLAQLTAGEAVGSNFIESWVAGSLFTILKQTFYESGLQQAFDSIAWQEAITAAFDQLVFSSLARSIGLSNQDIIANLPPVGVRAPAVVSLVENAPIRQNVEALLDKLAMGNESAVTIHRLEFDISNYELLVEFDLHHRHNWGSIRDLAEGLLATSSLSWDELVGTLRSLAVEA